MMELCKDSCQFKIVNGKRNSFQLDLGHKVIDLRFCQLLSLRKTILNYTQSEQLEYLLDNDNFILLFVADKKHLLYLDIPQILELREAINAVFYSPVLR